jgi:hypothetical protein
VCVFPTATCVDKLIQGLVVARHQNEGLRHRPKDIQARVNVLPDVRKVARSYQHVRLTGTGDETAGGVHGAVQIAEEKKSHSLARS